MTIRYTSLTVSVGGRSSLQGCFIFHISKLLSSFKTLKDWFPEKMNLLKMGNGVHVFGPWG